MYHMRVILPSLEDEITQAWMERRKQVPNAPSDLARVINIAHLLLARRVYEYIEGQLTGEYSISVTVGDGESTTVETEPGFRMPDHMCDIYPEVLVERALEAAEGDVIRSSLDHHVPL